MWLDFFDSLFFTVECGRIFFHLVDVVNLPVRSMTKLIFLEDVRIKIAPIIHLNPIRNEKTRT